MHPDHNSLLASCRDEKGFTLLEVLIAMTIFATTIAVLSNLFQTSIRQANMATEIRRAIQLGESQLARFGKDLPLELGRSSGPSSHDLYWEAEIALHKPPDEESGLALYRIDIDVMSKKDKLIPISLSTFRLGLP